MINVTLGECSGWAVQWNRLTYMAAALLLGSSWVPDPPAGNWFYYVARLIRRALTLPLGSRAWGRLPSSAPCGSLVRPGLSVVVRLDRLGNINAAQRNQALVAGIKLLIVL